MLVTLGLWAAAHSPAMAGQSAAGAEAPPAGPGKHLTAARVQGDAPKIDGRFDDPVWRTAQTIDDFTQQEPDNMAPPRERTAVQVAYDDRYLYVAVHCFVHDGAAISAGLGRRGSIPPSDRIAIAFDPRRDRLTGYAFTTNPSGVQSDDYLYNDTRNDPDFEAVWDVATTISAEGWNAEFRIPFSQVRFSVPDGERSIWGFQVKRDVLATGESDFWNASPRGTQGVVSRFGELQFDERLTPPRRVELLPFALVRGSRASDGTATQGWNGGADLRLGLGTSATLSATINPDFNQVEVDPAVLNLSVFETFYPEKRPFFLEDSAAFSSPFGQFPMFHSRRIGQTPGRLELADNETLVSKPDQTTILGAAKLSGKANGWTFGGLGALTAREYAIVDRTTTQADGTEEVRRVERLVEPMTMYGVGRIQRDLLHGTSTVGAMATSVVREQDLDAFSGGADFRLRWHRNLYDWSGGVYATHAPIDGVQKTGLAAVSHIDYLGKYWGFSGHYDHVGKTFHNTDLGFLGSRVDKNWVYGGIRASQPDPWKFSRRFGAEFFANKQWNSDGLPIFENINWWSGLTLWNYWFVSYGGEHNFEFYDDLDTRGGPPIVKPAKNFYNLNLNSDSRKRWGIGGYHGGNRDAAGGRVRNYGAYLRVQPSGRLQARLDVNYTSANDSAQWIDNLDADGDGIEDNVYGRLRRHVVNVTGRATYAFSRNMTIEAFLQPFVAVGDYYQIRKLARPKSFDFTPVALADDPDFSRKSLRGTVVLRWEYLRGSTLFLVWNTATLDESRPGAFSAWRDLSSSFGAPGANALVVKMTYWLVVP